MYAYSVMLGARNSAKDGKKFSRQDEERVHEITRRHFPDGFTIQEARGGWFDPEAKRFVREESRQVVVCAATRSKLDAWCRELAVALGQKQLLIIEVGRPFSVAAEKKLRAKK